jgi:hypothetical protein
MKPLFSSFFLGGFECATGHNREQRWIDAVADTQHDTHAHADYALLHSVGIRAARDGIRWPLVDMGAGQYDFSSAQAQIAAARASGTTVVWDLFHFGYPTGLDPLSSNFVQRFVAYCTACARHLRDELPAPHWFTPVNEPSFFSWAAGQDAQFAPHWRGQAHTLKRALVQATIHGMDAIRKVLPAARFLHVDPVCHAIACDDTPAALAQAQRFNTVDVFEALDMLCGRSAPELGGHPEYIDVIGMNYYWTCQWQFGQEQRAEPWLPHDDTRRLPFDALVQRVWQRYGKDMIISETAHWGDARASWIQELAHGCERLFAAGVPLRGVCLYPVIGMREWHAPHTWLPMGLWDINEAHARITHTPSHTALQAAQQQLAKYF